MTTRHETGPPEDRLPENEFRIYDCLLRKHDFMKSSEIVADTTLSPGKVIKGLDYLYDRRLAMARFVLDGQAIIVTVDEAMNSEVGFSLALDKLLVGVGADKANWTSIEKDWATFGGDGGIPDFIPNGVYPNELYVLSN